MLYSTNNCLTLKLYVAVGSCLTLTLYKKRPIYPYKITNSWNGR